jgi:hypothetical protein
MAATCQLLIKTPICFYYMSLNSFMQIKRWRPDENLKTTLPTHPYRKTFRLIPLWTPVNSRATLPLTTPLAGSPSEEA